MVGVPAWVWRYGLVGRAVLLGLAAGILSGALAFADSGIPVAVLIATVVPAVVFGAVMARRMSKFWPGAKELNGTDRVAVVRVARRGENIGDARLAHAVIDYSDGMRRARDYARVRRRVVWFIAALALVLLLADFFAEPLRSALVSTVVVALLLGELLWWPKREDYLVSNAERAEQWARQVGEG